MSVTHIGGTGLAVDGVIDAHAHLFPLTASEQLRAIDKSLAPAVIERDGQYYLGYENKEPAGPVPAGMYDVASRLATMDQLGVDHQVITLAPPQMPHRLDEKYAAPATAIQNDALLEVCEQHPDRFSALMVLPLQSVTASVQELQRLGEHRQVVGVHMPTNIRGMYLDSAELDPIWHVLTELDIPLWLHPDQREVLGVANLDKYYLSNLIGNPVDTATALASMIMGGVLDRFPTLKIATVHGGGYFLSQVARLDHGWKVRSEITKSVRRPSEYIEQIYFDSLVHNQAALLTLGASAGWDHVYLGTDMPFDMEWCDFEAIATPLATHGAGRRQVFSGTALSVFKRLRAKGLNL